jgi:DNA-binding GntR family transcriptional regulator
MTNALMSYREIADDLQRRVRAGEYPAGSPIPSYTNLARAYGVSESTVQRSIILLRDRGVVEGRTGRGVFVVGGQEHG